MMIVKSNDNDDDSGAAPEKWDEDFNLYQQ